MHLISYIYIYIYVYILLGVTHRDVKLENVLFVDSKNCKDIKIIDFGFSTVCQPGKKLKVCIYVNEPMHLSIYI
jgi:serine/threonine protein kinase